MYVLVFVCCMQNQIDCCQQALKPQDNISNELIARRGLYIAVYWQMTARLCAVLALCCLATAEKRPQTAYQTGLFKADKDKVIRLSGAISFQSEDTYGYAGRMVANGWDMFINWVNVARGPLTVNGLNYSFGLNYVEDYSDAAYVSDAFSQFISDGESSFYLGPYSSGLNAAAVAQTEPAGGLFVTAAASNSSIFKDNTYSFSLHPPDYELEEIAFKTFSGLGATSIAVAFEKGYPQCSNASESARLAAKYGLRLAGYYYTDPSSPSYEQDVDAVISSMKEQSAESAFICSYLDLCVQVFSVSQS